MRMYRLLPGLLAAAILALAARATAQCMSGVYRAGGQFVVLGATDPAKPATGQRYAMLDGRRGSIADLDTLVRCANDKAEVRQADESWLVMLREATIETRTQFDSDETLLSGELIEPAGPPDPTRPLVVMVHGSEKTSAPSRTYGYMLVGQGVSVFVYDKRGTGASEGEYTQNFELLADDAAAALREAQRLAKGRFARSGYYGGSQGGWVAPLAATRSRADFVAIGFGLVVSPIDEDLEQMLQEADEQHLGTNEKSDIRRLSAATAAIVSSHFERGFDRLQALRRQIGAAAWAKKIDGEYSGEMLRMSDADLRRIGRARFDNLELIWDYDAKAALARLSVPLLWVLAGEDREAPIEVTERMLRELRDRGQKVDIYLFPQTDHGMVEFRTNPDGSRTATRITQGYLPLIGDWIKGNVQPPYGRAQKL
jgi:pimeloyl-ACP methyl ester carboxylesterase